VSNPSNVGVIDGYCPYLLMLSFSIDVEHIVIFCYRLILENLDTSTQTTDSCLAIHAILSTAPRQWHHAYRFMLLRVHHSLIIVKVFKSCLNLLICYNYINL
jgi:hypothetical protein